MVGLSRSGRGKGQVPKHPQNQPIRGRTTSQLQNPTPKDTLPGTPMATRSHSLSQTHPKPQNLTQITSRILPFPQHQSQAHIPQVNSYSSVEEHDSNNSPMLHEFQQYGSDRQEEESFDDERDRLGDESLHDVDTPGEPSSVRSVRRRGLTRCLKHVTSSTKKIVYLRDGRAVGGVDGSDQHFVSQIGVLAKQSSNLPLQVKDFKDIPKETLIRFWNLVQDDYELHPNDDNQRDMFFAWIGDRYRSRRAKLKQSYLKFNTDAERKRNPPPGVISADWAYLVSLFGSSEKQAQSERNTINIGKSQAYHSAGSLSFGRLKNREEEQTGVEPNPLDFFKKTHIKKDGTPVNENAAQTMQQMDELTQQVAQGSCTYTPNEILSLSTSYKAHGHTDHGGTRRTKAVLEKQLEQERAVFEKQLEQERVRNEEQRVRHEQEISSVRNDMNNIREQMRLDMQKQMQEQMRVFMEKMTGGQSHQQPTNSFEDEDVNRETENGNPEVVIEGDS